MRRTSTKTQVTDPDDILPEYDFSRAAPNKFALQYPAGGTVIVLDPDVAAAFPNQRQLTKRYAP